MADQRTIQQMQADLQAYRSGGSTGAPAATAAPVAPTVPTAPVASPIQSDLNEYRKQKAAGTAPSTRAIPKEDPNMLAEFAKGIFSAPATLLARPVQAGAALFGGDIDEIDKFSQKISGGLIAPIPKTYADVGKDVGRGAQTVALGLGPIAGGALFGAGASVEQGNDLLSTETAFNTVLGAGAGKVLGLVGKPLLNATGKVVGTITPKVLQDIAKGGAKSIQEFAATHQLLGGVAAKPSAALARGADAIDNAVNTGASKLLGGTQRVLKEQFPKLSPTDHYKAVNERDILRPTTVNEPKYAKATSIYDDAKSRGIDLDKAATERGIIHDKIAEGGKYNTLDQVENIRNGNYAVSEEIARPAIKAAEPGVRKVPVEEVRGAMLKRIQDIPSSQIDAVDRAKLIKQINQRYADDGAMAKAHPNGFSLTDLHDARIVSGKNGKYKPGADPASALTAQRAREEGRVFAALFDRTIPDEVGMQAFRKEMEKNFLLADYLESLHGKSVPAGITKRAVRLFGRAAAATVGGKVGGFPGSILGAQYGDMLFSTFEALPNPIKSAVLTKAFTQRAQSPVFSKLRQYLGDKETERLLQKKLPAAGASGFKERVPTMFTTPGGKSTTIPGEAFDVAAVETGKAKAPKTDRRLKSYLDKVKFAQDADGVYTDPATLPVIKTGPKRKSSKNLNDIL